MFQLDRFTPSSYINPLSQINDRLLNIVTYEGFTFVVKTNTSN